MFPEAPNTKQHWYQPEKQNPLCLSNQDIALPTEAQKQVWAICEANGKILKVSKILFPNQIESA